VVRGKILKGDYFTATLNDNKDKPTHVATTLTYGFPTDIVIEAAKYRKTFGQLRYVAVAVKKFLFS
jgi:diacylglycerol kinase family enzyme